MALTTPVFVETDEVTLFPTVPDAVHGLARADPAAVRRVFDSEGRRLRIVRAPGSEEAPGTPAGLEAETEQPIHAEELRSMLASWLSRVEPDAGLETATLPELVECAQTQTVAQTMGARLTVAIGLAVALLAGVLGWWLLF